MRLSSKSNNSKWEYFKYYNNTFCDLGTVAVFWNILVSSKITLDSLIQGWIFWKKSPKMPWDAKVLPSQIFTNRPKFGNQMISSCIHNSLKIGIFFIHIYLLFFFKSLYFTPKIRNSARKQPKKCPQQNRALSSKYIPLL